MDSPPTSEVPAASPIRFLDLEGRPLDAPTEWTRAWVELDVPAQPWTTPRFVVNGRRCPVVRRELAGRERALVEWDRAGAGYYRMTLWHPGVQDRRDVRIKPWKLPPGAFEAMLDELERELPITIALALQRGGALADVDPRELRPLTLPEEVERLRRAVEGSPGCPGLAELLPAIARRPHRILKETALWVRRGRVRRIGHAGLRQAILRPANLEPVGDSRPRPLRAPDRRVEPDLDIYENRLVRAYTDEVGARLRRLSASLAARSSGALLVEEAAQLSQRLLTARREARFLDRVSPLAHAPRQLTMVLLRRPEYRAAFEGWLALHRSMRLRLREPALNAPLENTPYLYELWATLLVVRALVEAAVESGFRVERQELVRRQGGGLWMEALPAGRQVLLLSRGDGVRVSLTAQQSFGRSGLLRSVSFSQRPDVTIRIDTPGQEPRLILLDPKYKLESESAEVADLEEDERVPRGQPRKVDIDKMHAYRDAIRSATGCHVVRHASILFPGSSVVYDGGVGAIRAVPGATESGLAALRAVLSQAVSQSLS